MRANIFCETQDPPRIRGHLGTFEFEACPRTGERIVLRRGREPDDLFTVKLVSHEPDMPNEAEIEAYWRKEYPTLDAHGATLWLYVEYIGQNL